MKGAPSLAPGSLIDGKWRLDVLLGEGGMGAVFGAAHERNGLRVALKVLRPELAHDDAVRQRFLQEGYAANSVGHPGAVRVLDDGTTPEGLPYLVMERLDGASLEAVAEARGGKLPPAEVVPIAERWLEIVAAAHAAGIVHRDLKPENAFVCEDGAVKVLDFGLARVHETSSKRRLTAAGTAMGSPAFMSPEQALAHWDEVDARSDVFALGASLFALLSGRLVHEALTMNEAIVVAATKPAPLLATVAPQVPAALASVVDRALSFLPDDRYAHAGEMLAAWRAAAATPHSDIVVPTPGQAVSTRTLASARTLASTPSMVTPAGTVAPVSSDPTGQPSTKRHSRRWIGLGLAVGLCALALTAFLMRGTETQHGAATGEPTASPPAPSLLSTTATSSVPAPASAPPPLHARPPLNPLLLGLSRRRRPSP